MKYLGVGGNAKDPATRDQIPYAFPTDTTKSYVFKPGTGWVEAASGGGSAPLLMHVQHSVAMSTAGGNTTTGRNTRPLNVVVQNQIAGASLASNVVTLPVGTYEIEAFGIFANTNYGARLYIVETNTNTALISGPNVVTSSNLQCEASVGGTFVLASTSLIALQYRVYQAATAGLGSATGMGDNEVYADMKIRKLA